MSSIKSYIEVKVVDRDGKVVKEVKSEAKTLVANFIRALAGLLLAPRGDATPISLTNLAGGSFVFPDTSYDQPIMFANAGEGVATVGIMVGSSDIPFAPDQVNLISRIPHGSASGQLWYLANSTSVVTLPDGRPAVRILRNFENRSGGDVVVVEVGLACRARRGDFLIDRTVLSTPVTVPPDYILSVSYTITTV